jgi:uncharacterized phage-associated protein
MRTATEITDWILSKTDWHAGDTISPLKLHKLLYYSQAWHYTLFGEALFDEAIEAWAHGPVVPSQYIRFRETPPYASIDITCAGINVPALPERTRELLDEIMSVYGEHSASYLEHLVHGELPWKQVRGDLSPESGCNREIPLALMKDFYATVQNK